jgi:prepilin-type N-terminal cleavage/methylation domain-containing protein
MIYADNQRGFTLVELLVGLLAIAAITYAALSLYIAEHNQLLAQEQISDMQANMRTATEMLGSAIRKGGFNLPETLTPIETDDTGPDTITVTFDSGALVAVTSMYDMVSQTDELRCDHADDISKLTEGDWAYIYDDVAKVGEFFEVTRVLAGPPRIQHITMALSRNYPAGSDILKISRLKFFVSPNDDSTSSNLMIQVYGSQPEIMAENIIDLNFRYFLESGAIVTQTNTPSLIRMVEIDVLGRTESADPEFFQDYRTRNFTLRVKVRNLGVSWSY